VKINYSFIKTKNILSFIVIDRFKILFLGVYIRDIVKNKYIFRIKSCIFLRYSPKAMQMEKKLNNQEKK